MSIMYSIIPYTESMIDETTINWLSSYNIILPTSLRSGRYPTITEMKDVIQEIKYQNIAYQIGGGFWMADLQISDVYWVIIETTIIGNENEPHRFTFTGDEKAIIAIVVNLAKKCGTFILVANGENPKIIT